MKSQSEFGGVNDYVKNITDKKYGDGASDYIVKAFRHYPENNTPSEK